MLKYILGRKGDLVLKVQRIQEIRRARNNGTLPSLLSFVIQNMYIISITNILSRLPQVDALKSHYQLFDLVDLAMATLRFPKESSRCPRLSE